MSLYRRDKKEKENGPTKTARGNRYDLRAVRQVDPGLTKAKMLRRTPFWAVLSWAKLREARPLDCTVLTELQGGMPVRLADKSGPALIPNVIDAKSQPASPVSATWSRELQSCRQAPLEQRKSGVAGPRPDQFEGNSNQTLERATVRWVCVTWEIALCRLVKQREVDPVDQIC